MNQLGQDLTIVISCECTAQHHFMAFASWYSLQINLPDANKIIACDRGVGDYFSWIRRLQIPLRFFSGGKDIQIKMLKPALPCIVIEPEIMAVRELSEEILRFQESCRSSDDKVWYLKDSLDKPAKTESLLYSPSKSDSFSTFVNYEAGWGKFVVADCINRKEYPFRNFGKFHASDMSLNETKIFELWKRMDSIFTATGG